MTTKKRIKKAIKYYRECCTYLREILDFCDLNGYNYAFVGGFIRWCLDENFESTGPRDLDVIIDMPKEELLWFLDSKKIKFKKIIVVDVRSFHIMMTIIKKNWTFGH